MPPKITKKIANDVELKAKQKITEPDPEPVPVPVPEPVPAPSHETPAPEESSCIVETPTPKKQAKQKKNKQPVQEVERPQDVERPVIDLCASKEEPPVKKVFDGDEYLQSALQAVIQENRELREAIRETRTDEWLIGFAGGVSVFYLARELARFLF